MSAALESAETLPGASVDEDAWDADPLAVNTRGGLLDLRSGLIGPHARDHHRTGLLEAEYVADARCAALDHVLDPAFTRMLGSYGEVASAESFAWRPASSAASPEVARLAGKRFVYVPEAGGIRLDSGRNVTGFWCSIRATIGSPPTICLTRAVSATGRK